MNQQNDIKLICEDCEREFSFTVWEQDFFEKKGWPPPIRCPACRRTKKILRKSLEDNLTIKEQGAHRTKCAKCGKEFLSTLDIKEEENEYCTECWKEIKGF